MILCASCADASKETDTAPQAAAQCAGPSSIAQTIDIPAGIYRIGDDRFYPEETPVLTIKLSGFNIDATEVTNGQFAAFVEATGYITRAERGLPEEKYSDIPPQLRAPGSAVFTPPGSGKNLNSANWWRFVEGASWNTPMGPHSSIEGMGNYPVVHVSFEDALAYAKWKGRRLPTEDEWEAAARGAHNATTYAWGDQPPDELDHAPANNWQGIFPVINQKTDGYEGAAPVGCFPANLFGLYDMIGNVWEMTSTGYTPQKNGDAKDFLPSTDAPLFESGVIKGGSYLCAENYCLRYRPAARQPHEWALGSSHIGFRTVSSTN